MKLLAKIMNYFSEEVEENQILYQRISDLEKLLEV